MTESEIKAYIASEVAAQLQAITSKDIASESDVPTLSDAEWDTNNSITSLPVVYNGSAWRKIGAGFLRTLRNAAAVVSTAWNALKNNGTSVSWIPTVDTSGNAGKTSPADLAAVLGVPVANGWGGSKVENVNTINRNGFYWADNSSTGLPNDLNDVSIIVHWRQNYGSGDYGLQILMGLNTNSMFVRQALTKSTWNSWKRIHFVE